MFKTAFFKTILCTSFVLLASPAGAQSADDTQPIIRVYDVRDLTDPQTSLLGDWLTGENQAKVSGLSHGVLGGGGSGGAGFGGGSGGAGMEGGDAGGGGFFSIPSHIQPQFGGGGMGGMGGGMIGAAANPMFELMNLLTQFRVGDAQLSHLGHLLVAKATQRGHQELEAVLQTLRENSLSTPTIEVALRLVAIESAESGEFHRMETADIEALAKRKDAISATVRCGNGRIGTIASGARRSFVISAVPVVGANGSNSSSGRSVGYSPRVITPMIGLVGKVRPILDRGASGDSRSAQIDIGIAYSIGSDEILSATFGNGTTIDRIDLTAMEYESQVNVVEDRWTLAGMSTATDGSGEQQGHMAVVVQWREVR
ncbi:hypothetical protein [Rosistilla oblonga]|uniref:hypothetical protein n=1 Tax=Rosistilla oblonga TaxID=2527990 RepID=UPI0011A1508A|nr:hypothetical protein [Rosistilla oblonga]